MGFGVWGLRVVEAERAAEDQVERVLRAFTVLQLQKKEQRTAVRKNKLHFDLTPFHPSQQLQNSEGAQDSLHLILRGTLSLHHS